MSSLMIRRLACVAGAAMAGPAVAGVMETATLSPAADGDVVFQGAIGYTVDGTDVRVSTSRSGGNNVRHGVYEFDLASLPAGIEVTRARLLLTTASLISNTGATAEVNFLSFAGDGTITQNDHGDFTLGTLVAAEVYPTGSTIPVGTTLTIELDDTMLIESIANGDVSGTFGIRSETVNFVTFSIASLENSDQAAPRLVIDYIPSPGTASLAFLGGITLLRRRRSAH